MQFKISKNEESQIVLTQNTSRVHMNKLKHIPHKLYSFMNNNVILQQTEYPSSITCRNLERNRALRDRKT